MILSNLRSRRRGSNRSPWPPATRRYASSSTMSPTPPCSKRSRPAGRSWWLCGAPVQQRRPGSRSTPRRQGRPRRQLLAQFGCRACRSAAAGHQSEDASGLQPYAGGPIFSQRVDGLRLHERPLPWWEPARSAASSPASCWASDARSSDTTRFHLAEFEALGARYAAPGEIGANADIVSCTAPDPECSRPTMDFTPAKRITG